MSYTAIIVEPRKHAALEFVLINFLDNLDYDWNIIIYHGKLNLDYLNNIINTKLNKYIDRITIINLDVDNLTIQDYNNLMVNKYFIESIPTEVFLIFQTDSMICHENKNLINKFIEYDYVGAPWIGGGVGNGGLSLRRKSKMLEILNNCPYQEGIPEDVYFGKGCNNIHIYKPTDLKAKEFSIENVYSEKSFGIHKSWSMSVDNNYNLDAQCQNYNMFRKLNIERFKSNNRVDIEYFKLCKNNISDYRYEIYSVIIYICIIILLQK